jgi:peptidoglycan/xylan/chitin deacetylase (PgdA/CDA1 family)
MKVQALGELRLRAWNKYRRILVNRYGRRPFAMPADVPYISFTFDDFPRSALLEGGRTLIKHAVRGTYYISLQLVGSPSCVGEIATKDDLRSALAAGHELGCHTFEHLDGCNSSATAFERSIASNKAALAELLPDGRFSVFAYPLDGPVLAIKRAVGRHFVCCRGGGQTFNSGSIDLNLLSAYFLDRRNQGHIEEVRKLIAENTAQRGWLIFATHDVAAQPSPYGCTPAFFEEVVRLAVTSGARVVPVMQACRELRIAS